jgi:uncharacterized protein (TIGR03067 family)
MRTVVVIAAVSLLAGADTPEAVKKEMAQLEGNWSMVSGERDGQAIPDDIVKQAKRASKDGETTVSIGEQVFLKAKYTIDPTKKPKTIDYTVTEGDNKGQKMLGIYELDGDTAKFCFAAPGKDRPTDFTTKEGSERTLSVWKRDKK